MEKTAIQRDMTRRIEKYLGTDNCIVLHGARQVGKTHILYLLKQTLDACHETTHFMDLEDSRNVAVCNEGAEAFVAYLKAEGYDDMQTKKDKKIYVFIDEVQHMTNPSSFLKLVVDHYKHIQLIVSGSSSFNIKSKFKDSLVGRTVDFEIFNLSFREFLRFKGKEHLVAQSLDPFHLKELTSLYEEYVLYGGYPKIVLESSREKKEMYLQQIIDTYIKKDIRDLANIQHIEKFNNLIKILAAQSGQLLNISSLANACALSQQTIEDYLFILENTYIIQRIRPFSSSPTVEVVKAPKIFFYDTGLMQMLHLQQLQRVMVGTVFETSVFSELVKKYGTGALHYWRNRNQNEIDFIVHHRGVMTPIEVKTTFDHFKKQSMSFFIEKYKTKNFTVVSLKGTKKDKHYMYPWEL